MNLHAHLTEYTVPLVQHAGVIAEVERPDHTTTTVAMAETDPGIYEGSLLATMSGIYRFNVLASGVDYKGRPFTREQLLNGAVFAGGDTPLDPPSDAGRPGLAEKCCQMMTRLGWVAVALLVLILIATLRG
jgi:hypothetical protein